MSKDFRVYQRPRVDYFATGRLILYYLYTNEAGIYTEHLIEVTQSLKQILPLTQSPKLISPQPKARVK